MPNFSQWARAAGVVVVQEGVPGVARYLSRRLYLRNTYYLYERELTDLPEIAYPPTLTEVREATATERRLLPFAGEDFDGTSFWGELEPGAVCYVGLDGPRIVVVHWVSLDREPNDLVLIGPGECVVGPIVTVPDHRGKGVFTASLVEVCRAAAAKGLHRMYAVVREDNEPSIRGFERVGFRRSAKAHLTRLLGLRAVRREVFAQSA